MSKNPNPSTRIINAVKERDGGLCVLGLDDCWTVATCTDHRANRGMGGSKTLNHPSNLIAACSRCNHLKAIATGNTRQQLIDRGLIIRPAATDIDTLTRAFTTPIITPTGEAYLLLDEHTRVLTDAQSPKTPKNDQNNPKNSNKQPKTTQNPKNTPNTHSQTPNPQALADWWR